MPKKHKKKKTFAFSEKKQKLCYTLTGAGVECEGDIHVRRAAPLLLAEISPAKRWETANLFLFSPPPRSTPPRAREREREASIQSGPLPSMSIRPPSALFFPPRSTPYPSPTQPLCEEKNTNTITTPHDPKGCTFGVHFLTLFVRRVRRFFLHHGVIGSCRVRVCALTTRTTSHIAFSLFLSQRVSSASSLSVHRWLQIHGHQG